MKRTKVDSSFRDPSGFVFKKNNKILRKINSSYFLNLERLNNSGLYNDLVSKKLLIAHKHVSEKKDDHKVIEPDQIPFISYPYEWSFSQLKDAALLTLQIQKIVLESGMTLKDASGFNVQFIGCKPIFIDTLSFEKYSPGQPWLAYRQFCEHFLAPLALMSYKDARLSNLLKTNVNGISLDLAVKLLSPRAFLNGGIFLHIFLHSRSISKFSGGKTNKTKQSFSKTALLGLVDSLENTVKSLSWKVPKTIWSDYYDENNYNEKSFEQKGKVVGSFINEVHPKSVWDIGANNGFFSRISSEKSIYTISMDFDPATVEMNYMRGKKTKNEFLLPLLIDLVNPSPSIGWANLERDQLDKRNKPDLILALALIHHLAIANNLPFEKIAEYFASLTNSLIIEFVPKTDTQVEKMLASREDIFPNYNQTEFEKVFGKYFSIMKSQQLSGSKRKIYLMIRKK